MSYSLPPTIWWLLVKLYAYGWVIYRIKQL
jgi:hypothetical protein